MRVLSLENCEIKTGNADLVPRHEFPGSAAHRGAVQRACRRFPRRKSRAADRKRLCGGRIRICDRSAGPYSREQPGGRDTRPLRFRSLGSALDYPGRNGRRRYCSRRELSASPRFAVANARCDPYRDCGAARCNPRDLRSRDGRERRRLGNRGYDALRTIARASDVGLAPKTAIPIADRRGIEPAPLFGSRSEA
jgi:hypothetical protein